MLSKSIEILTKSKLLLILIASFCFQESLFYCQPNLEWVRRYPDSTSSNNASSFALELDDSGNAYVTGIITINNQTGFCTIKYSNSGEQIWVKEFFGTNGICYSKAIAVDKFSNVYVTGYSNNGSTSFDYCTVKYNSDGIEQWYKYYNSSINGYDEAEKIAVDNTGNIYVSGFSQITGGNGFSYTTIKYSTDGNQLWVKTFPNLSPITHVRDIKVDSLCNVYLTGVNGYALTVKYDSSGNQIWFQTVNAAEGKSIVLDNFQNVYVTGYKKIDYPFLHEDFLTVKYSNIGVEEWAKLYNTDSAANGSRYVANSIVLDSIRNIYVSGFYLSEQNAPRYLCLAKYSNEGNLIKVEKRSDTLNTERTFMKIDEQNKLYFFTSIVKSTVAKSSIVKFDSSLSFLWYESYIGTNDFSTDARYIIINSNNNIFITGIGESTNHTDIFIAKFSQFTGIHNSQKKIASDIHLFQNYPNPFNPSTRIEYTIPTASEVNVIVYDISGQVCAVLVNEYKNPGVYMIHFNGSNLSSGVYFYRLKAEGYTDTKKMLLIK